MNKNITKEELKFIDSGDDPIYTVQIKDFHHKMKNWSPATAIYTKAFQVQNVNLYLKIYPNGQKEVNRGHVSVFLVNPSSKQIFVNFKLQISDLQEKHLKSSLMPKLDWGYSRICDHAVKFPDFKLDEDLQITCTILKLTSDKIVWDTYFECKDTFAETNIKLNESKRKQDETNAKLDEAKRKHDETNAKLDETKNKLQETNTILEETKTKFARMENRLETKLASMENRLVELQNLNNNSYKLKKPPCPICFEKMSFDTKIFVCQI